MPSVLVYEEYPPLFISQQPPRTELKILAAILCLTGIAAVGLAAGSQWTGQVSGDLPVIYQLCRNTGGNSKGELTLSRDVSCGIDEKAMTGDAKKREQTEQLREKIEAEKRLLTPKEEKRINEHLEQQFLGDKVTKRRAELDQLLQTTTSRLQGLLDSPSHEFTESEAKQLQTAITLVATLSAQYDRPDVSKRDIGSVRDQLAPTLTDIHVMLTQKKRDHSMAGPKVESLVTRIDALVARVGTVIRDLERAGKEVPVEVRSGHERALQLVRKAKRNCSTRRPAACSMLSEVLTTIEVMREPLCRIDSPLLSFC